MPEHNPNPPYKRIATEEAWLPQEILELYRAEIRDKAINEPGFQALWGFFAGDNPIAKDHNRRIVDLGEERLSDMDRAGIDIAVLSLSSPGVQIFDAATATSLAIRANDELAEGIAKNPDRYVGLAAFSPLDPEGGAKELERGVTKLGLRGGILNSHTLGTYMDDENTGPFSKRPKASACRSTCTRTRRRRRCWSRSCRAVSTRRFTVSPARRGCTRCG